MTSKRLTAIIALAAIVLLVIAGLSACSSSGGPTAVSSSDCGLDISGNGQSLYVVIGGEGSVCNELASYTESAYPSFTTTAVTSIPSGYSVQDTCTTAVGDIKATLYGNNSETSTEAGQFCSGFSLTQ